MNSEEIKQQGEEMVERYLPYAYYDPGSVNVLKEQLSNATRAAIAHCKRVIEVLELSTPGAGRATQQILYRLILSELEGRVK